MWNLLQWLYPLMSELDCIVMEEGQGPYIHTWNELKLGPQPTQKYLDERLPEFELESLRTQRITEVFAYGTSLINTAFGDMDQAEKNKTIVRQIKLIRKENRVNITSEEIAELDHMESLSDYTDDVDTSCDYEEKYLESNERTLQQLQEYSAETSPVWPTVPEI